MTHTCFLNCRQSGDCYLGFESDSRSECNTSDPEREGLLCAMPTSPCENYVMASEICFDSGKLSQMPVTQGKPLASKSVYD